MSTLCSACLLWIQCRYDGKGKNHPAVQKLLDEGEQLIPVCPEQLWGLSTPRIPAEQQKDGHVVNKNWVDVTEQYSKWAEEALRIAQLYGVERFIGKAKSPSCGCGKVYDGSFTWTLRKGDGEATKLLKQHNIEVTTENDL